MTKRRVFSKAFKIGAVRKATKRGGSVAKAARELELDPNLLWKWQQRLAAEGEWAFPGKGNQAGIAGENRRLVAENGRLRVERDILKKVWSKRRYGRPRNSPSSRRIERRGRSARCARRWG